MPSLDPIILISWEPETAPGTDEPLPDDLRNRVIGLTYVDKARGADECNIRIANADLSLFDDHRLAEGNKIYVQWGYAHEMSTRRELTIKEITGWSTLEFKCAASRDLGFISVERHRVWANTTIPDIAEEIALEMGFSLDQINVAQGDLTMLRESIVQSGETDYAFLQRIADMEDLSFRIVGNMFHFHPSGLGDTPLMTWTYFDDPVGVFIGEPRLEKGSLGRPGRVTRRGHSPRERRSVEGVANNSTDSNRVQVGDMITVRDPMAHTWVQRRATRSDVETINAQASSGPTAATSDQDAQNQARRQFRNSERSSIKLAATVVGMPNLRADTTVRIEGIGETLTGNYYIEEVTHSLTKGYECPVKLKRNAASASSSGRQRGRARRNTAQQQIWRDRADLQHAYDSGTITQDRYNRVSADLDSREDALLRNAGGNSQGRVNNRSPSPPNQPVPQTHRTIDGRWVTRWVRPGEQGGSGGGS